MISIRGSVDDYCLRGEIRSDLNKFSDAQLDYNQALELAFNHENPKIIESIAFCHKAAGQYFEAIQAFNRIINTSPMKRNIILNRGVCKLELQDYRGAIVDFNLAINAQNTSSIKAPYKEEILVQKARASIELKDYTSAIKDLIYILKSTEPGNDEFKSSVYNLLGII